MNETQPYSPAHARLHSDRGSLPHGRHEEMVIRWNDGPIDPSKDLLRFTFDVPLGEARSGANRADRHDPQEPCASPTDMAEEVLAREAVPYQERVLAHLRASLTLPGPPTITQMQQEAVPEGTPVDALHYGIHALPSRDRPSSYHRWGQHVESWADTDPGFSFFFPGEPNVFSPEVIAAYEQQLFEELYQILWSLLEQARSPATEAPDP